jgi:ABC-2 type transport system permease protein
MLRQLLVVWKVMLRSGTGLSLLKWRYIKRRERLWEPVLILVSLGMAFGVIGYGLFRFALVLASVGASIGHPELVLVFSTVSAQMMVLIVGFFWVVSAFFFARDLALLVPLPIRPGVIVAAKFLTLVVWEYGTIALAVLPGVVAYAVSFPFGGIHLFNSVVVFLLLPVIPLAASSLAALLLMRVINRKHRDAYMVTFSIVLMLIIIGVQSVTSQAPRGDATLYFEQLIRSRLGLVQSIARYFPPAGWAALAVHLPGVEGFGYLGLFAVASAMAVAVLYVAGNRLFFAGAIGGEEAGKAAKPRATRELGSGLLMPAMTPLRALVIREWRLFMRTPLWVMNGLSAGVIVPFALLLPLYANGQLQYVIAATKGVRNLTPAGLGMAAVIAFLGSLNTVASTSVSREGRKIWISRILPVDPVLLIDAKMINALIVTTLSIIPTVLLYAFIMQPSPLHLIAPTMIGLMSAAFGLAIGLRFDLARPMLRWNDPQEPVKRNLNGVLPMGAALVCLAAGGYVASGMMHLGMPAEAIYGVLFLMATTLAVLVWLNLRRNADRLYGRIEM